MPSTINVTVYADEIKEIGNHVPLTIDNEKWTYIGLLSVPEHKSDLLLHELARRRCLADPPQDWTTCTHRCRFHRKNDTEIHYQEFDDRVKSAIGTTWLKFLLENDLANMDLVHFYILGINLTRLDLNRFGGRENQDLHTTIYNRFFRTVLRRSLRHFYRDYDSITVSKVIHDSSTELAKHGYFPWHSLSRIGAEDDKIAFRDSSISFVNSDHREPDGDFRHSHFLQFIDVILGTAMNCLHFSSSIPKKMGPSSIVLPLFERLIEKPRNPNSRYHYVRKHRIEFCPGVDFRQVGDDEIGLALARDAFFFEKRLLKMATRNQLGLFEEPAATREINKTQHK